MSKQDLPMRVLHVLPTRAAEYGGLVAVAEALVEELMQQGVEATLYPPLPTNGQISFAQIPVLVRRSNLVHIHGLWELSTTVAARAARAAGIPYIVTPHGMLDRWSLQKSSLKKRIYGFLFERRNLAAAASLHFLNNEELDEAKDYGIPFSSFVLANGVFAEKYALLPDRMNFLQNHIGLKDKVLALFLGRLHPKKGFDLLLPALARAIEKAPNLHLLIAGPDEGGYKAVLLEMMNQYHLQEHVTFLGMVQGDVKMEVLAVADFFVLSSHQEGDSIAVKEAMASGLPVAITPACHFPEVMALNAGFVVRPDVREWSRVLIELAEHESTRRQMGANAVKLINEQYTWPRIAGRLKLIYENLAESGARMVDSCVYATLPRGGLGNKMLVWARALVFAQMNGLPLFVSGWAEVKLGPYLRGEKSKRQYWGYFSGENDPGILKRILFSCLYEKVREPTIEKISSSVSVKTLYVYDSVPSWMDYFSGLRGHEDLIRESFFSALTIKYHSILAEKKAPVVGVHIRLSDFRELKPGEILGSDCNVRTPIEYYIRTIELIRSVSGQVLPVTIFTDGRKEDVLDLLALPQVQLAEPNPDIVDLLLLSRSKCIIISAGSTFSYWAAFLSDAPVVTHPGHELSIRSERLCEKFFEGPVQDRSRLRELFIKNIREIVV